MRRLQRARRKTLPETKRQLSSLNESELRAKVWRVIAEDDASCWDDPEIDSGIGGGVLGSRFMQASRPMANLKLSVDEVRKLQRLDGLRALPHSKDTVVRALKLMDPSREVFFSLDTTTIERPSISALNCFLKVVLDRIIVHGCVCVTS